MTTLHTIYLGVKEIERYRLQRARRPKTEREKFVSKFSREFGTPKFVRYLNRRLMELYSKEHGLELEIDDAFFEHDRLGARLKFRQPNAAAQVWELTIERDGSDIVVKSHIGHGDTYRAHAVDMLHGHILSYFGLG